MNTIKKFSVLLSLLSLGFGNAQTIANNSGIGVQGIVRDQNNTVRGGETLTLTFQIYFKNTATETNVLSSNVSLDTDSFGVFSHVLDISGIALPYFSNYELYLRITEGNTVISDELLNYVPYAVSAQNGVPTGSIMPYLGLTAPDGWLLCDGSTIPINESTEALRNVLGANTTPNLQGMFLRGSGTSPQNGRSGPALMSSQNDSYERHLHGSGSIAVSNSGNHSHTVSDYYRNTDGAAYDASGNKEYIDENLASSSRTTSNSGSHSHIVSGSTAYDSGGGLETRPVNYGVNYIVKL